MLGTAKEREEARPPADASGLEGIEVRSLGGDAVRLGDLWAERPGVLVFLRHYG
jgi:hypothetical protein